MSPLNDRGSQVTPAPPGPQHDALAGHALDTAQTPGSSPARPAAGGSSGSGSGGGSGSGSGEEEESSAAGAGVTRRVQRHLLPYFFALALLCSMDRTNLSFAAAEINADLCFTKPMYGLGSGIFFLGYTLLQLPTPAICARLEAPTFLGIILVLWGVVSSLFAAMRSAAQFYTLRFLLGVAESGAYPAMWLHLARFLGDHELSVAYAAVATATAVAGVLGGPAAALLLSLDGLLGLRGWQWMFALEGVPAVVLGVLVWQRVARSPATAPFLTPPEQQWLVQRKAAQDAASQAQAAAQRLPEAAEKLDRLAPDGEPRKPQPWAFLRSWQIWWLCATWMLSVAAQDGVVFWAPLLIQGILGTDEASDDGSGCRSAPGREADDMGQPLGAPSPGASERTWAAIQAALLSIIPFGTASFIMLANALHSKRAEERHRHCAWPLLAAAASALALALCLGRGSAWLSLALLSAATAGIWAVQGPLLSWPAAVLPAQDAASGFALVKMVGALGSFAGPLLIGGLTAATGAYAAACLLLSCILLVAALLALTFPVPGCPVSCLSSPQIGGAGGPRWAWLQSAALTVQGELMGALRRIIGGGGGSSWQRMYGAAAADSPRAAAEDVELMMGRHARSSSSGEQQLQRERRQRERQQRERQQQQREEQRQRQLELKVHRSDEGEEACGEAGDERERLTARQGGSLLSSEPHEAGPGAV